MSEVGTPPNGLAPPQWEILDLPLGSIVEAVKAFTLCVGYCYIVGQGLNCKFTDLLFKCSFIKFIKISLYLDFIVLEIICKQTDTLNQKLIHQRQF